MPRWVKHLLWGLVAIILIARWRDVAGWLRSLGASIRAPFSGEAFSFDDPVYRFAAFGLLLVTIVTLWAIYWNNKSKRNP